MKKGQRVRVLQGPTPPHRGEMNLVGLEGTATGRTLGGYLEVTLPAPGSGKPFGFLMDRDELEEI